MPKGSFVSGVFMGTTSIPVHRTISEVQQILIRAGAQAITTVHEKSKITGMSFSIPCINNDLPIIRTYTLPIRTSKLLAIIQGHRKRGAANKREQDTIQAERIAWRQILRWLESQFALIETGMSEPGEVFLPYQTQGDGRTVYQVFQAGERKMLEAGTP
jgi:hypothetical protein